MPYPTVLDAWTNPTSTTKRNDPGFELDVLVARSQDAIEALEAKVGITASVPAANTVLGGNSAGASTFRLIATGDITANAITQASLTSSLSASTTSTTYVDLTPTGIVLTTTGGRLEVTAILSASMAASANVAYLALSLDAATEVAEVVTTPAGTGQFVMVAQWIFTGVSSASHTVKARWKVSGSTLTTYSGTLKVEEVKK